MPVEFGMDSAVDLLVMVQEPPDVVHWRETQVPLVDKGRHSIGTRSMIMTRIYHPSNSYSWSMGCSWTRWRNRMLSWTNGYVASQWGSYNVSESWRRGGNRGITSQSFSRSQSFTEPKE